MLQFHDSSVAMTEAASDVACFCVLGPLWICVTLVFSVAISGNLSTFLSRLGDSSYHYRPQFHRGRSSACCSLTCCVQRRCVSQSRSVLSNSDDSGGGHLHVRLAGARRFVGLPDLAAGDWKANGRLHLPGDCVCLRLLPLHLHPNLCESFWCHSFCFLDPCCWIPTCWSPKASFQSTFFLIAGSVDHSIWVVAVGADPHRHRDLRLSPGPHILARRPWRHQGDGCGHRRHHCGLAHAAGHRLQGKRATPVVISLLAKPNRWVNSSMSLLSDVLLPDSSYTASPHCKHVAQRHGYPSSSLTSGKRTQWNEG